MMKKLLGIVVLGLLWCNVGASAENKFRVQELNINLSNEYELQEIEKSVGTFLTYPYKFTFYAQVKEGKFISLLETFYVDTKGEETPAIFLKWAKAILYKNDPNSGCNESSSKQYVQVNDKGTGGIHCVSVKILNSKEIYSPSFEKVKHIDMKFRKRLVKKFIEKNNLKVQDQMLRSEHFFWNKKKLIYVFLTNLTSDNLTDEQIENFIINAVDMHKGFENDLKIKPEKKIDFSKFPTTDEGEAEAKAEAETEAKAEAETEAKAEAETEAKAESEATGSRNIIKELKELKELYDSGILTKEQFEKAKDVLLSQSN